MSFAIIWKSTVLDHLADLYVASTDAERRRMAGGVEHLNRQLEQAPLDVGESRHGGYRVAFPPLLMVTFFVDESSREVRVVHVVRFGR